MKILQTLQHPLAGETVVLAESAHGVRLALCPTPGFSAASAHFGLRFGSADTRFRMPDGRQVEVPDGSAHYLEHKLFEGREEKVFDRFGRLGASFNGGTGFHATTYHFESSGHFEACLEVLTDFVQHPLITEDRVDKERGIIEQEVRMYDDHPAYRGIFLLHQALYHNLPIQVSPGGRVADVHAITAADLQSCFDGFYRPQDMCLSLAGDFDPEQVLGFVEQHLDLAPREVAERTPLAEPAKPEHAWLEESFPVSRPQVYIGFREPAGVGLGAARMERRILSSLVLDLIFDRSSEIHEQLYRDGIVDDSLSSYWTDDAAWGHVVIQAVHDEPKVFVDAIQQALNRFAADGPSREDAERLRRAAYGASVSSLQTPSALASSLLRGMMDDDQPFATLDFLAQMDFEQLNARAREMFGEERRAVAILQPGERSE